jgi:AAA family ATP:ADP antiporter
VVITVLDYEMKVIGRARYGDEPEAAVQFATLMGHFGQVTNVVSFLFSLFGFSFVMHSFGIKRVLRLFPALLLLAALGSTFVQGNLWILFGAIATLKAMTYSMNEPAKELMYAPTTDAIKFKAKTWIDVLGMRAMKAMGSAITHTGRNDPALLVRYGSVPTILISLALLGISVLIGKQFEDLMSSGEVVGHEDRSSDEDERSHEVNEGVLLELDLIEKVAAPQQLRKDNG